MRFKFDVTNLDSLERDFKIAREQMSDWDWYQGGYLSLYLSQKNRLLREKEQREQQTNKNKRAKK